MSKTVDDLEDDPLDDRIRAYYELQGCALNPIESDGRAYASHCDGCGKPRFRRNRAGEVVRDGTRLGSNGDRICASRKCQATWPFVTVVVSRGVVQKTPRPQSYEAKLVEVAGLGYELNRMLADARWRWASQVLVGYCVTSCSYDDIAQHANKYAWPHPRGGEWTEPRCRAAAVAARRELRSRLRVAAERHELRRTATLTR